jgi:hypothetical protein
VLRVGAVMAGVACYLSLRIRWWRMKRQNIVDPHMVRLRYH